MPVPSTIADLSATASSNYPSGSEPVSVTDDHIRALGAILRQVSDAKENAGVAASAITVHKAAVGEHAISGVTGLTEALAAKQATLVSGTNIKTVNGASILGSGDLSVTVADGDKGDITVSSGGTIYTIDQKLTLGTAKATTSGTAVDFTGIPSWVKRITVVFNGVSTNGTSVKLLQLGTAGGVVLTGYNGVSTNYSNTSNGSTVTSTVGVPFNSAQAADVLYGTVSIINLTGNTWVVSGCLSNGATFSFWLNGAIALGAVLDRIRITTVNGTDTFDSGSVNIMYE